MEANPSIPCHHCQQAMRLVQTVDHGPLMREIFLCMRWGRVRSRSTNPTGDEFFLQLVVNMVWTIGRICHSPIPK